MAESRVVNPTDRSEMNYAVGVVSRGNIIPYRVYFTEEEMDRDFPKVRKFALRNNLVRPIKATKGEDGKWGSLDDLGGQLELVSVEDSRSPFAFV